MGEILRVCADTMELELDCEKLFYTIRAAGHVWRQAGMPAPHICRKDGSVMPFSGADRIRHTYKKTGVGEGILSQYGWMAESDNKGKHKEKMIIETLVWIEYATKAVHFELIPVEGVAGFGKIYWPGAFSCEKDRKLKNTNMEEVAKDTLRRKNQHSQDISNIFDSYTVLPLQQGLLIPDTWGHAGTCLLPLRPLRFHAGQTRQPQKGHPGAAVQSGLP